MSEKCEKCKVALEFPSAREVLAKSRDCPACGHTQRVEKSILYVVETLEERHEWLDERLQVIEAKLGITARIKPQPVPPKKPRIAKQAETVTLAPGFNVEVERGAPAAPPVDLFAEIAPAATAAPAANLPDLF